MRRDGSGIGGRIAGLAVLLLATLLSGGAEAGLRLVPDGGYPPGGDVRCLAASGGVFWAGTASGVFRGASLG